MAVDVYESIERYARVKVSRPGVHGTTLNTVISIKIESGVYLIHCKSKIILMPVRDTVLTIEKSNRDLME